MDNIKKKCSTCQVVLDGAFFDKNHSRPLGLHNECKACRKIKRAMKESELKEKNRLYHKTHRDEEKKYREKNKEKISLRNKKRRSLLKNEVFNIYGNGNCCCCGEREISFLSIEHVGGGGRKHRKALGIPGGDSFYKWLKDNNFPDGYEVLCMNCQFGRSHNGGICPHQTNRETLRIKTHNIIQDKIAIGSQKSEYHCELCGEKWAYYDNGDTCRSINYINSQWTCGEQQRKDREIYQRLIEEGKAAH